MTRRLLATAALALVAAGTLPMSRAYACSCGSRRPPAASLSSTVFYGDVLRREVDGQRATYVVAVERVYYGDVGPVAEVHTSSSGASCGLEIPASGPAVFYATRRDGGLSAMLCGGTHAAPDGPPKRLGAGRPPAASPTASPKASPKADPDAAPGGDQGALPVAAGALAVAVGAGVLWMPRRRPKP